MISDNNIKYIKNRNKIKMEENGKLSEVYYRKKSKTRIPTIISITNTNLDKEQKLA